MREFARTVAIIIIVLRRHFCDWWSNFVVERMRRQRAFRPWKSLWAASVEDDACWDHLDYASDKSGDAWLAPLVVIYIYISIWYYFSYTSIYLSVSFEVTVASLNPLPLCRIAVFSIKPTFLSRP